MPPMDQSAARLDKPSKQTLLGSIIRETDLLSPIKASWDADR